MIAFQRPKFVELKKWTTRVLCSPAVGHAVGLAFSDCIPYCGVRVSTKSRTVPAKNKAALFFGVYESAERRFVRRYLDPNLNTIELGSSIGGVSSHIAACLAKDTTLICVEANPIVIPVLRQNLARNAPHIDYRLVHGAIHYASETVSFDVAANPLDSAVGGKASTTTVPAVRLSTLVEQMPLHESFQLVSDIEGAELQVLLNDAAVLSRFKRCIVELHEVNSPDWNIDKLETEWLNCGFTLIDKYGPVCVLERIS